MEVCCGGVVDFPFCPKDTEQVKRLCQSTERYERQRRNLTHTRNAAERLDGAEVVVVMCMCMARAVEHKYCPPRAARRRPTAATQTDGGGMMGRLLLAPVARARQN